MQQSDWDSALAEMRQALSADANNPTIHNQMGDLHLRKENIADACEHFEKAIDLYAQVRLHNNAVALCRKVMRLAPSRVEVRYSLARLRFDQGLRADGVAAFADYLDNVPTTGEDAIAGLEERCRSLVDSFPDAAPVGKILEKLESVHSFNCAFEIVQRLAQRAADAGDNASASKYVEKMRSLKVLVHGSGGGDIIADAPETQADDPLIGFETGGPAPSVFEIDASNPETLLESEPAMDSNAPPSLEMPAVDVGESGLETFDDVTHFTDVEANAAAELDPPAAGPPFPAGDMADSAARPEASAGSLDDLLSDLDAPEAVPPHASQKTPETPSLAPSGGAREVELDLGDSDPVVPEINLDPGTADPLLADGDASARAEADASTRAGSGGFPEYELPEGSLDDLADLLEQDQAADVSSEAPVVADDATSAAPPPATPAPVIDEGLLLGAAPSEFSEPFAERPAAEACEDDVAPDTAPAAASNAAQPPPTPTPVSDETVAAAPQGAVYETTSEASMTTAGDAAPVPPASRVPEPRAAEPPAAQQMPQPQPHASGEMRQPVWIPDPDAAPTAAPEADAGQVHELDDVIETFRDQMAKALGNDAAARYDLGVAYYEMGLYNEALTEFEIAVHDERFREPCFEMMAACLTMQGRHAQIVEMLSPVIDADEASVGLGLRYTMGVACEALGLREDARHHFEQIARIDSSYRDVQARLKTY